MIEQNIKQSLNELITHTTAAMQAKDDKTYQEYQKFLDSVITAWNRFAGEMSCR